MTHEQKEGKMPSEIKQIKELREIIAKKDEQIVLLKKINAELEIKLRTESELRIFLNGKVQGMTELLEKFSEV